ncbi:hypothetical protein ACHAXA_003058 [Cyclostephanos tholiformis]|uniref:Uncharacterized protein n=1 Tax=Cyclostephanos tholiformis TaxID=382380 RepID=A0ABD3RYN1_9STRA
MTFSKEEAHWSSFRSAVAGLQNALIELSFSDEAETERSSADRELYGNDVNSCTYNNLRDAAPAGNKRPQSISDDLCNEDATTHYYPHYFTKDRWQSGNTEIEKSHRHLELIGLEEIEMNNNVGNEDIPPTHSPTQSSNATVALSITTQQLAEMRLKLALTESERDELEFRLMQGG